MDYPDTSFFEVATRDLPPDSYVRELYARVLRRELAAVLPTAAVQAMLSNNAGRGLLPVLAITPSWPVPAHERMRQHFLDSGCTWAGPATGAITLADLPSEGPA